ncbi:MAG: ATP synthase F1 subunit gamma, partial [Candidatus Zixiibacteriota bacterium]
MATLKEIRSRIKSVKSTRQITKAMEMVAAAKFRRAQQRVLEARPYADHMGQTLSSLAEASGGEIMHPFFETREIKKRTLVLIISDRGLCGSYNSHLLRSADRWLAQYNPPEVELALVGSRALDYYKRRQYPIAGNYCGWGGALDYQMARSLVSFLTRRFSDGETDAVNVIYARFISTAKYLVTNEQYLPVKKPEVTDSGRTSRKEYIFEPSPEEIYASLMPGYSLTLMIGALLDSFASEHSAR